jgi:hypothetical protein
MGMFGAVHRPIAWGLASAIYHLAMAVVMVHVPAFIIDALKSGVGAVDLGKLASLK